MRRIPLPLEPLDTVPRFRLNDRGRRDQESLSRRKANRSVRKVADGMAVSRPVVSQRLMVLRASGLIVVRVDGARRLYGVDLAGIEAW